MPYIYPPDVVAFVPANSPRGSLFRADFVRRNARLATRPRVGTGSLQGDRSCAGGGGRRELRRGGARVQPRHRAWSDGGGGGRGGGGGDAGGRF